MAKEQPDIIEVEGLRKSFGNIIAVNDISFTTPKGEIFGFLGPNGAGKTTTINMLTGLARPDAGIIRIDQINCTNTPKATQHLIGVVPDESNLYPELTGLENLCFCGALYGMRKTQRQSKARELLEMFGLDDAATRRFGGYSKGMKRKLTIAAGIIHQPCVLFLDEPTTGIDVAGARQIRQLIAELHEGGTTIFLTTHYIEEAERLCDRIAFIVSGRIVETDTVPALLQRVRGRHIVQFAISRGAGGVCEAVKAEFPHLKSKATSNDTIHIESSQPVKIGLLVRFIEDRGAQVAEARMVRPSLEDVFIQVTGIEATEMKIEKERAGAGV